MEGDYDLEMPTPYEIPPNNHSWSADVNTPMPKLLIEAEKDLHEQRPIYDMFVYCIPFTQLFSQIVGRLYSTNLWGDETDSQIHVARLLSREVDAITNNTISIFRQLEATPLAAHADRTKYGKSALLPWHSNAHQTLLRVWQINSFSIRYYIESTFTQTAYPPTFYLK